MSTVDIGPGNAWLASHTIPLADGRSAVAVVAPANVRGEQAVEALGLPPPRGVVVLNGGTSRFSSELEAALWTSLGEGLARAVVEEGLTTVTGGTDAGIFGLFGRAVGHAGTAPRIGVAPEGRVTWPGREAPRAGSLDSEGRCPLEPHHSHFLLVAGNEWGAETDAMLSLAQALGAASPSVAVVAGGGRGARREVAAHVREGREVIVLAGSGRFADALAAAVERPGGADDDSRALAASGLITVVALDEPPVALGEAVRASLGLERRSADP